MVGRVLRAKKVARLLDLRGMTHVFGNPTADMEYSLDGVAMRPKGAAYAFCAACGAVLPAYPCGECKYAPPEPEMARVVGAELRFAAKRLESIDERRESYQRWAEEARVKGYKQGHAMWRYKGCYGSWPPKEVLRAVRNVRGH